MLTIRVKLLLAMPSILLTVADAECLNPEAQYVEDVITLMRRNLVDHHGFGTCVSNPFVSVIPPHFSPSIFSPLKKLYVELLY